MRPVWHRTNSANRSSELSRDKEHDREQLYSRVREELVDLERRQDPTDMDPKEYDAVKRPRKRTTSVESTSPSTIRASAAREKIAKVYFCVASGAPRVSNKSSCRSTEKALWSTLYGYLALKSDLETIQGLTFYEHAETPGLGGEVDNPAWKAQWEDQKLYDESGEPAAEVFKGTAPSGDPYAVDGLSGATITSRGVTNTAALLGQRGWIRTILGRA